MRALIARCVPGIADLNAFDGGQNVVIAAAAKYFASGGIDDSKGQAIVGAQCSFNVGFGVLRLWHGRCAQLPELPVAGSRLQASLVLKTERQQTHIA